jgi:hypothetical protein
MYVALDRYVKYDHNKEWKMWEQKIALIDNAVKEIPGIKTEVIIPPVANRLPSLNIAWDPGKVKLTRDQLGEKLRKGTPSIEVISWETENSIRLTVFMLKPEQEKIVARRIREELVAASS